MGKRSGDQQIVLEMLTERDPEGLFGSGTTQAFRAVHAVLLGFLEQPCSPFCYPISSAPDVGLMGPERDVLALMAHGHTINEIAERLGTNEETVRVFLNQSAIKMGVTSGDEALATALARGFLSL